MRSFKFIVTCLIIFLSTQANSQINGKVIEVSKTKDTTVVVGAIISWSNTSNSAITNELGDFKLINSTSSKVLIIQAIGFETRKISVSDTNKFLLLIMKPGLVLDEIELVYYSTGTEISYLNPIKTEILNERSLMKAACCNLSESFETNPSIDVNFADAITGTKQIQMLGLSGQYAQITKENMPYLRGLASNYGLTFIPGSWIQSIQLSKGVGSVINGYESFTGQINTELQNPLKSDKLNFNTYINENARNEYNLNLSRQLNKNLSIGLLSHTSFNPLAQDKNNDGFADIPIGKQYNFMNKYGYSSPNGFEAQFGGGYLKDTRSGGQFLEFIPNKSDSIKLYKLGVDNEKWEVYSKTGYVFKNKPGTSMGLQTSYLNHQQNNFYGNTNYQGNQKTFYLNYIFQGIINTTDNVFKIGTSYLNDNVSEIFDTSTYERKEKVIGTFIEFTHNYKEKFNFIAGIRADYHNYYGLFYTPRIHLRYAFKPTSVLRLSAGKALRTSSIFSDNSYLMASSRKWTIEPSDSKLPYGLKPESGWNYGLNYTQKFKINYREAYVTLDIYRTDFTNQVVTDLDYDPQQVIIFNLKGSSYSNTLQFEFNLEPRKRFFIKTAYRFVDTKVDFKSGLLQKSMVSKHRAFINLSYETKNNHWLFDFTNQFNGEKRLPSTESNPLEYKVANYSPSFFNVLGQITFNTKIYSNNFNIYLGVENLLNYKQSNPIISSDLPFNKYFDASMVWGPIYGRMLYLGMRYKIK